MVNCYDTIIYKSILNTKSEIKKKMYVKCFTAIQNSRTVGEEECMSVGVKGGFPRVKVGARF